MRNKIVLITGASSGFGRDTAETLAKAGYRVFASMRDSTGRNKPHADALRAKGINVVELDVTSDACTEKAVAEVTAKAGGLDMKSSLGLVSAVRPAATRTRLVRKKEPLRSLRALTQIFSVQGAGLA